jgi:hypothetical protein
VQEEEEDLEDDWTPSQAASVCLSSIAMRAKDAILPVGL